MEGPVYLKRKKQWVRRIAKVEGCVFSYKNSASDKKAKISVDLLKAKVYLSPAGDERKQSMIYI